LVTLPGHSTGSSFVGPSPSSVGAADDDTGTDVVVERDVESGDGDAVEDSDPSGTSVAGASKGAAVVVDVDVEVVVDSGRESDDSGTSSR
jgi:hypothetical protein